jgi:hypothetical protein
MRPGYAVRATRNILRHPQDGIDRVRGRVDRRRDKKELDALGIPASDFYGTVADWAPRLHAELKQPWPCQTAASFGELWDRIVSELNDAGVRVGKQSYGGWNDCDRAFAEALWCIVAHARPVTVVETGVAHGVTSRVILEGLERHGNGHLWSIDLPAVDPAFHRLIGIAIPENLRNRWTYIEGTSRQRLPQLLMEFQELDLFVHDSLHTRRNLCFELESAWAIMRPGGLAVVDDINHSLGFRAFVDTTGPATWLSARHVSTAAGLWGLAIKPQR